MKNVLVKIRNFGKVIALPFFKKFLFQNIECLGHNAIVIESRAELDAFMLLLL